VGESLIEFNGEDEILNVCHSFAPTSDIICIRRSVERVVYLDDVYELGEVSQMIQASLASRIDDALPVGIVPAGDADPYPRRLLWAYHRGSHVRANIFWEDSIPNDSVILIPMQAKVQPVFKTHRTKIVTFVVGSIDILHRGLPLRVKIPFLGQDYRVRLKKHTYSGPPREFPTSFFS
jgi:hypothetical protein